MATHSSILAWRIPWTEEPGRLQSIGSQSRTGLKRLSHMAPYKGFPDVNSGKEPAQTTDDVRDVGSVPGSERSPGGGHGHPIQYSCLENPMDRGAWRGTVHRVAKVEHDLVTKAIPPSVY